MEKWMQGYETVEEALAGIEGLPWWYPHKTFKCAKLNALSILLDDDELEGVTCIECLCRSSEYNYVLKWKELNVKQIDAGLIFCTNIRPIHPHQKCIDMWREGQIWQLQTVENGWQICDVLDIIKKIPETTIPLRPHPEENPKLYEHFLKVTK